MDTEGSTLRPSTICYRLKLTAKYVVPVLAIGTKFDGLITKFFGTLRDQGVPPREARAQSNMLAVEHFNTRIASQLRAAKHPPAAFTYTQSM